MPTPKTKQAARIKLVSDKARETSVKMKRRDMEYLAWLLWSEARGQGEEAQRHVASTIFNRRKNTGRGWMDLMFAPEQYADGRYAEGDKGKPKDFGVRPPEPGRKSRKAWEDAFKIAGELVSGTFKPCTDATNVCVRGKEPSYWKNMKGVYHKGPLTFGRDPSGYAGARADTNRYPQVAGIVPAPGERWWEYGSTRESWREDKAPAKKSIRLPAAMPGGE